MIKKIKNILIAAIVPLAIAAPMVMAPVSVSADCNGIKQSINQGVNAATSGSSADCTNNPQNGLSLPGLASKIVNLLSIIVGVVAVVMIIIGGFRYITSGGESGNVSGAKNTLIYAIVGLIIVALAQFIVHFVLTNVNNT